VRHFHSHTLAYLTQRQPVNITKQLKLRCAGRRQDQRHKQYELPYKRPARGYAFPPPAPLSPGGSFYDHRLTCKQGDPHPDWNQNPPFLAPELTTRASLVCPMPIFSYPPPPTPLHLKRENHQEEEAEEERTYWGAGGTRSAAGKKTADMTCHCMSSHCLLSWS